VGGSAKARHEERRTSTKGDWPWAKGPRESQIDFSDAQISAR